MEHFFELRIDCNDNGVLLDYEIEWKLPKLHYANIAVLLTESKKLDRMVEHMMYVEGEC